MPDDGGAFVMVIPLPFLAAMDREGWREAAADLRAALRRANKLQKELDLSGSVSRKLSGLEPLNLFEALDKLGADVWLEYLPLLAERTGALDRWGELIGRLRMQKARHRRADQKERVA